VSALLDQSIRVSVLLAGVLVAAALLRRRSASLRHWVLAAGVLAALALPAAGWLVPEWSVLSARPSLEAAPAAVAATEGTNLARHGVGPAAPVGPRPRPEANPSSLPLTLWALGAGGNLLVLLAGVGRLAWHGRRARRLDHQGWLRASERIRAEVGLRRTVTLLETTGAPMIGAWGWRRPRVMVPASARDWPATDVDLILRHELAHLARGDWHVQLAAECLRALHWFNPLAWVACARLRLESERACDDAVLVAGVRGEDYAARLLHLATVLGRLGPWRSAYPAPGMARSSSLERRVTAMLDPRLARGTVGLRSRVTVPAIILAIALPLAGLVLAQSPERFAGTVVDQTGKNVANAKIVLTDAAGARREIRSAPNGRFEFADLAPGSYDMMVSLPGFASVRGTVAVASGGTTRDIKLQLGSLQESITISAPKPGQARPAPSAPRAPREPRPAPPCVADATGGNVRPPMKVIDVKPEYSEALYGAKVGGLVVVEGIVGGDGTVRDLKVIEAPHADLGRSVVDAVRQWRFTPTLLNCEPTDVKIKVNATFVLD
jgi:TonB family protein